MSMAFLQSIFSIGNYNLLKKSLALIFNKKFHVSFVNRDFEGLGSFKRTEQDDGLLSVFNILCITLQYLTKGLVIFCYIEKVKCSVSEN